VDAAWNLPAHPPLARGVCLLLLLHHDWAGAVSVLVPLHATGVLQAPVVAPVAALPRSGSNLRPLL
jgi:hypothetical protein